MSEHIRFITVGFADLINHPPAVNCAWCTEPIVNLRGAYQLEAEGLVFCDDYCYSDWAQQALADDV